MRNLIFGLAAAAALYCTAPVKAETIDCTEITTLPAIITTQGVYCFKGNLVTGMTSGSAIDIQANNVTIDMNGFKLGGAAAGAATTTRGIFALDRNNFTLRNGNIRGFYYGVRILGTSSSGHLLEDLRLDGNTYIGLILVGSNHIIRNNQIINTGPTDSSNAVAAFGIDLNSVSNTQVIGNVIGGVSETGFAYGIFVTGSSSLVEIRDNAIFDLKDATIKRGIYVSGGSNITISGNRVLNPVGTGTNGIYDIASASVHCIDNIIAGYITSMTGCDYSSGNHTP